MDWSCEIAGELRQYLLGRGEDVTEGPLKDYVADTQLRLA